MGVYPVAAYLGDFEIYAPKFDNVPHANYLLLIVGEEVFEDLIHGALLPNDQPHRLLQVNVILFIFVLLSLLFRLLVVVPLEGIQARPMRYLSKIAMIQLWLVVRPQFTILRFKDKAKNYRVGRFEFPQLFEGSAVHHNPVPCHDEIFGWLLSLHIIVMHEVLVAKLLIIVLFLLVNVEIGAVKVEQTVGEFVAGERAHYQLTVQLTKEAKSWQTTH